MGRRTVHPLYEVDGFVGTDTTQTFTGDESGATPGKPINPLLGGSGVDPADFTDGQVAVFSAAGQKLIGGQPNVTTKRVSMPLLPVATASQAFTNIVQRFPILLPVNVTRARLRIANRNNGGPLTGALNFSAVYIGDPLLTASGWDGACTGPLTSVSPAFAGTADGSEVVTPWFNPGVVKDVMRVLSIGTTNGGGVNLAKSAASTSIAWIGTGASESAGDATATGSFGQFGGTNFLDVVFEYEFAGDNQVGVFLGDSVVGGVYDDLQPNVYGQQATFPAIAGLRDRFAWVTLSIPSGTFNSFDEAADPMYARVDLTTTVPDFAVIQCGINSAASSASLASVKTSLAATIAVLKAKGVKRVFLATVIPQPQWKPGKLLAAAASAATSMQTSVAYAAGDVIDVDFGVAGAEQRTVASGGSTGAVAPFATPLTAGLTNPHGTGATVNLVKDSLRQSYNLFFRSLPPGVSAIFDFASAINADNDRNQGGVEFYGTGNIHPGAPGHAAMAATVDVARA